MVSAGAVMLKLGFIGLGNMGEGMAQNLARAGFPLTVRDLRPEPVARLAALGAHSANSNFDVGQASDLVCIAVFTDEQVRQTCLPYGDDAGVIAGLAPGGIIAIHSTVPTSLSRELTAEASRRGIHVVDAPMTGGGEVAAREGKLTFFVGGDAAVFERGKPAFAAMHQNLFHVAALGAGAAAKTVNNFLAVFIANAVGDAI